MTRISTKIAECNMQRNIFVHEAELEHILIGDSIDIMFLTEVDNKLIDSAYKICEYDTIIHKKSVPVIKLD